MVSKISWIVWPKKSIIEYSSTINWSNLKYGSWLSEKKFNRKSSAKQIIVIESEIIRRNKLSKKLKFINFKWRKRKP